MLCMRTAYLLIVLFFLMFLCFPVVDADKGMLPITPGVWVYEPGQKAVIAWNGREEILILSTDVRATVETLVLEILPLPSMPVVESASIQIFQTIQEMIWDEGMNLRAFSSLNDAKAGSVEVVFYEQIGAHNITVVKADRADNLTDWMNSFLSASGVDQQVTLQNFETVVEDYMSRGFRHYVLDIITFSPQERSIDPILFRFNSSTLYYPLLITSPVAGDGEITLFTLTNEKGLNNYWPLQLAYYRTYGGAWHQISLMLSTGDLTKIDLRIAEMFQEGAWLSVLEFKGSLGSLYRDLMLSESAFHQPEGSSDIVPPELPFSTIALFLLLGAALVAVGVIIGAMVVRLLGRKQSGKDDSQR